LPWRAAPADLDESAYLLPDPLLGALSMAAAKARAVRGAADEVILAADTLVVLEKHVLGKPADTEAARGMLGQLRGRSHQVLTGVVLRAADDVHWGGVVSTRVVVRDYADSDVDAYIASGEPFDKAGAYAIQDELFRPVERLEGCYLNVVGLPLCAVVAGLEALGVDVAAPTGRGRPPCGLCRAGAPLVSVRSAY
jgi:septum formation protein